MFFLSHKYLRTQDCKTVEIKTEYEECKKMEWYVKIVFELKVYQSRSIPKKLGLKQVFL